MEFYKVYYIDVVDSFASTLMALAPFNNCSAAEAFARYRPLDYALAAELLFSLVALFAFVGVALRLRNKSRRPMYHPNLKVSEPIFMERGDCAKSHEVYMSFVVDSLP